MHVISALRVAVLTLVIYLLLSAFTHIQVGMLFGTAFLFAVIIANLNNIIELPDA